MAGGKFTYKDIRKESGSQSIIYYLMDEKEKCERDLDFSWMTSSPELRPFKLLLVFPRNDYQCEVLAKVARKLGWSVSEARNFDDVSDLLAYHKHDLAIIDRRSLSRYNSADKICTRLIEHKIFNILAMVKRTFFTAPHKDDMAILQLLNLGYSRAIIECAHEGILMNELIGICSVQRLPQNQLSAAQLMYSIYEKNRMVTIVTSGSHNILFANKASERFDFDHKEIIGKNIEEFIPISELNSIKHSMIKKNDFQGEVLWKTNVDDSIKLNLFVTPLNLPANKCEYYVYSFDPMLIENPAEVAEKENKRAISFHDLPAEAPIVKIITLLTTAISHTDDFTVQAQIKSALQLLRYVDLYMPHITEESKNIDPVAESMIESLNNDYHFIEPDSSSIKNTTMLNILEMLESEETIGIFKDCLGPPELEGLLETIFDWNFDIFKLEAITDRRPLYYAGIVLMGHYRMAERLQCDEQTLRNWLTVLEANYNNHVEYHNSTHATDVMQALARFIRSERLKMLLEPLDEVAALIAAAAHDLGHPGKSSQFLCSGSDKLAILYNDLTVLESHHAALTFKITLCDDRVNIFKNLNRETYRFMRTNIIDMILATEMTKHYEHLAKFVNVCHRTIDSDSHIEIYTGDVINTDVFLIPENLTMTKRMIIKCADVSNPTRPMRETVEWTRRIATEYFDQTDEEKNRNWPVMMPSFDRATCSIPKSQIGFVDYIIYDMIEAWDTFIDMPELVGNMNQNYANWKAYAEQGIHTIKDVENLQATVPELQIYKKKK